MALRLTELACHIVKRGTGNGVALVEFARGGQDPSRAVDNAAIHRGSGRVACAHYATTSKLPDWFGRNNWAIPWQEVAGYFSPAVPGPRLNHLGVKSMHACYAIQSGRTYASRLTQIGLEKGGDDRGVGDWAPVICAHQGKTENIQAIGSPCLAGRLDALPSFASWGHDYPPPNTDKIVVRALGVNN